MVSGSQIRPTMLLDEERQKEVVMNHRGDGRKIKHINQFAPLIPGVFLREEAGLFSDIQSMKTLL